MKAKEEERFLSAQKEWSCQDGAQRAAPLQMVREGEERDYSNYGIGSR